MNKKMNFLLLSFLASIFVFAYLSYHHYMVKLGLSGSTLCQISQTINCDSAALSKYAEIMTIPIAVMGLSYSIIMLVLFLFAKFGWLDETNGFKAITKFVTAISALVSLFLLAVSIFQLHVFCPFCVASYVLSFIIMFLVWSLYKDSKFSTSDLISEKGVLITFAAVPFLAWIISGSIRDNYGLNELEKIIPEKVYQWQMAPVQNFDNNAGLVKGNMDASAPVLVEFADFKCPHCKAAAQTLKTFMSSQSKIKMVFKPYPLDGVCNPHIPSKGDGTRCELAGWALCAEKLYQKGWEAHYWIFDNQESMMQSTDLSEHLKKISARLGFNTEELKACATSAETYELIKKSSDEGDAAKISGTPTIFINGKKLEHGQIIDVLRAAVSTL